MSVYQKHHTQNIKGGAKLVEKYKYIYVSYNGKGLNFKYKDIYK